ncbi:hypothetical protein VE04_07467 [Pseudogymnoascus sp. 24MN13]|nr:hypothetical protein VE04_07467 [Pseudogymnoascus sp. 24MN13]
MKLAQLEREKNDTSEKLRIAGKRVEHLARAVGEAGAKKLPADYEEQRKRDLEAYDKTKSQVLRDAEAKHAEDLELSKRLTRITPIYEEFKTDVVARRHDEFEKRRRDAEKELEKQINQRRKEHRERKIREKREREEQERILREEEERAAVELAEKAARDERRRQEFAELKAQRDKERQEGLEKAALQARREEEALARRAGARATGGLPVRAAEPERSASSDRRPPPPLAGAELGWREKEALRAAGQEVPSERTASPAAPAAPAAPFARTDSNDRPSGPPRLALAGGKPSWRDKEAARVASGTSPAPESRDREAPVIARTASGTGPVRGRTDRNENERESRSPAPPAEPLKASGGAGKYIPKHLRDKA